MFTAFNWVNGMANNIIFFSDHRRVTFKKILPQQRFILIYFPQKRLKWRAGKVMRKPPIFGEHAQRIAEYLFYPWQIWWLTGRYGLHSRIFIVHES